MARRRLETYHVYLRVSSENQTDGISLDAQRIACLGAAPKNKTPVFHQDIGSAYSKAKKLPGRTLMLNKLKINSTLVVYRLDRLSRNVDEAKIILNRLEELNVVLIAADKGAINYKNNREAVLNAFREAEAESTRLGSRIKLARDAIIAGGGYPGSYVPYGYTKISDETNQIIPDEHETKVMRLVDLLVNNEAVSVESTNEQLLDLSEFTEELLPVDEDGDIDTHFHVKNDFKFIAETVLNWYEIFRRDGSPWTAAKLKADYERWIKIRRLSITDEIENLVDNIAI